MYIKQVGSPGRCRGEQQYQESQRGLDGNLDLVEILLFFSIKRKEKNGRRVRRCEVSIGTEDSDAGRLALAGRPN